MSHLNMDEISELKDIMEDAFPDLVEAFILDSEEKLTELKAAVTDGDVTRVGELGHSLKGASSNICAGQLADIYKQIEAAGRNSSLDGVDVMINSAMSEFQEVKSALQAL